MNLSTSAYVHLKNDPPLLSPKNTNTTPHHVIYYSLGKNYVLCAIGVLFSRTWAILKKSGEQGHI